MVTLQRWSRRHSLVLSDFAGHISAVSAEPRDARPGARCERSRIAGRWECDLFVSDISPRRGGLRTVDRIIDQIRASKLPSNMMQFAARGALQVAPAENIEILVYLAKHNKVFGELARITLAGWDEKASRAAAADPQTSPEVLNYLKIGRAHV